MNKYNLIDLMTSEIEFEGEKYKFDGIQIPMIQRDYAHGREGESEIRKRFLNSIFNSLENNIELELDFVYGAKKSIDKISLFIPLDGQQRLTTLYLFNWYIGNRELENEKLQELRIALERFSYATRSSSNKFCKILTSTSISFNKAPSIEIRDSSWFFDSFGQDPTIQSMLVMLDAIHSRYGDYKRELFSNLEHIRFYILPLDGFELTDELYIKMNARGKQLTQFENFKADLIKWVKDPTNPFKEYFHLSVKYDDRTVKYYVYFELKLDNHWSNLFWRFSKKNEKLHKKLVDPYIMQFWNRYLLNSHIINCGLSQDTIENDDIFKKLYGNQGDDSNIKYNDFDSYKTLLASKNRIKDIEIVFESLVIHFDEISEIIKPNWDKNDTWELFSETINQRQRIIFFATTIFLETNSFDSEKFGNWMRIVWNIIIDPNIRSVPAMVGAMRFISELSKYSNDIYTFLKKPESVLFLGNTTFETQIEEEHIKSILIRKSSEWEESIIEAESHPLFHGNIRFLLANGEDTDYEYFQIIKNTSFDIYQDNDLIDKNENYLWIRALLAKSSDIQLPITLSNGRFSNWRYLINSVLLNAMRLLIDDISKQSKSVEECLMDICANYQRDDYQSWVYPLVFWTGINGETLLGNYSVTRKIQKYNNYGNDPEHVFLYNQTRWTESNIMLSSCRNELIRELLYSSKEIKQTWEWGNIQNSFFRGWTIQLERQVENKSFLYVFDRQHLRIGIKSTPELVEYYSEFVFEDDKKEDGWICRVKHDFTMINEVDIKPFITSLENELFNKGNPNSLINKLLK